MSHRVWGLAGLLGAEILLVSLWFDGENLRGGLAGVLGLWGSWLLRWAVGFAGFFLTFAYLRHRTELAAIPARQPVRLWLHAGAFVLFTAVSYQLYAQGVQSDMAVVAWAISALGVLWTAAFSFFSWDVWAQIRRITGKLCIWSAAAATIACSATTLVRGLWEPTTKATFWLVQVILSGVLHDLVVQPERMRLGTPRFMVMISPECSGLEGIGLLLMFGILWLVVFRDELRFPRAFLLLPVGVVVLYIANALRIAALVLIGHAGAREIARQGFHSQAGWIAFNLVAFGLLLVARQSSWVRKQPVEPQSQQEHPAAVYLVPFLAIVASGMLAGALSAGFEWMYGLRVLACASALWLFRKEYSGVDWRCGWLGPAVGVFVFALWMWQSGPARPMPAPLLTAGHGLSVAWIALRTIGAIVTVPIAEELAFRGFLLRRLISEDFDKVSWQAFSWSALLLSSVLFGLMHGGQWMAGTVAGILYALSVRWRGRLGDAIAAHAVTNALLAVSVLAGGRWDLW